ncbi:hypothetical protein DFH11DRAFT_1558780 [Phellopilus nigrolimitatus]|nr:hypothetical protein DFH11DRAFT_1558780 [Phellopilus nigrolimitatus]
MADVLADSTSESSRHEEGRDAGHRSTSSAPFTVEPPVAHADMTILSHLPVSRQQGFNVDGAPLEDEPSDSDIYRGEPRSSIPRIRIQDVGEESVASSSSSSTSSSSLNVGRRLGALATSVEAAITRWARIHSSSSSKSSSSSSSSASTTTRTHVARRRRSRRHSSSASVYNMVHERAILARKRAREEFRAIPREFTLLLPSEFVAGRTHPSHFPKRESQSAEARVQANERRIIRTTSMPLIVAQLDSALKKSAKWRRTREKTADIPLASVINKGKGRKPKASGDALNISQALAASTSSKCTDVHTAEKGWWLDIASPTWDDLRSIGKLLHLHPLTLEDILHQDPREKLELFPGLGYYFVVFRALEGEQSRQRFRQFKTQETENSASSTTGSGDEGATGAVNVYLVVFREGICSFHFEDISEHTDKLRNKVLHLEDTFLMTSDWIAHGLLDSIVDSFFPILAAIEKEVKEVDDLVLRNPTTPETKESMKMEEAAVEQTDASFSNHDSFEKEKAVLTGCYFADEENEKRDEAGKEGTTRLSLPVGIKIYRSPFILFCRLEIAVRSFLWKRMMERKFRQIVEKDQFMSSTSKTLLRMAATRRIVTSLGRLLGTKGDVVAQIRKRLLTTSVEASSARLGMGVLDAGEVAIYMGDIQDHIVTLQQSLTHYERMLSHSHPAYLSQLRISQSVARSGTDTALLLLTVVSVSVLSIQVVLGLFSVNLGRIPSNAKPGGPYNVFYVILSIAVLIGFGIVTLVRYWQMKARKKFSRQI